MLETLSKGFRAARQRLTGEAELTDDLIEEAIGHVRMSLLEADVDFQVTSSDFLERVTDSAPSAKSVTLKPRSQEYRGGQQDQGFHRSGILSGSARKN